MYQRERCVVSLLGNSIQILLEYKTLEPSCLHYTACTHQFFCLPGFGGFVCLFLEFFLLFKGRNEHHLKVLFLGSVGAAVLCGEESGKGH